MHPEKLPYVRRIRNALTNGSKLHYGSAGFFIAYQQGTRSSRSGKTVFPKNGTSIVIINRYAVEIVVVIVLRERSNVPALASAKID